VLATAVLLAVGSGVGILPAVATASPGIAPAAAPLTGMDYVALGDSFTADWGVDPVAADQPSTGCRQSTNDYPHQVAANLGLNLTDVSCAGALTTNMTQPQTTFPDGLTHPEAPPQFDALTSTTEIVTIGIGGNDFGFGDIAGACALNPSLDTSSGTTGRTTTPPATPTTTRAALKRTTPLRSASRGHDVADRSRPAPARPTPPAPPPTPTGTPTGSPVDSQLASSDVAVGSLHPNIEGRSSSPSR